MDSFNSAGRELRFVAVDGEKSRVSSDRKERSSVRAFVMRDYLRQKNDPTWKFTPAKVADRMNSHISRFRSTKPSTTARPRKRKPATGRDHRLNAASISRRPLIPATMEESDDQSSTYSSVHDLDMVDPFRTLDVDLSEPETQNLLQYYQSRFWANSYACNPEARWISVALMDPAIIHATLSLVAVHRRDCFSIDLSDVYFKHRGEAMKIVAKRLSNLNESLSDETIGAVAMLSSSDNHFDWPSDTQTSHSEGLSQLISFRGGLDSLSSNRHIQRVAGWADMLQSALHGTKLQVKIPAAVEQAATKELETNEVQDPPLGIMLQDLPPAVEDMLRQLRILSSLKAALLAECDAELCLRFSNMLWKLEYTILERLDKAPSGTSRVSPGETRKHNLLSNVVGIAVTMFSYLNLRDLAAPILYTRLSARLQNYLSKYMFALQQSSTGGYLEESELDTLLWCLYLGYHGTRKNVQRQSWFVDQLAQICWRYGILTFETIKAKILSVVPQAPNVLDVPEDFWFHIEDVIWSDMLSLEEATDLASI